MIFSKKDKELSIRDKLCFSQLKCIEKTIDALEQSISEKNIHRNYEKILLDMRILKGQLSIPKIDNYSSEIVRETKNLEGRLYEIYDKIIEVGTKSKKEILNKLDRIDTFNKTNSEIKGTLEWIWDRLNLDNVEVEDDITDTFINRMNPSRHVTGKLANCSISCRQINSYESCINHAISKNTKEAVHLLYEFVDNYQYNIQEPFNSYERISIRTMIKIIIKSME